MRVCVYAFVAGGVCCEHTAKRQLMPVTGVNLRAAFYTDPLLYTTFCVCYSLFIYMDGCINKKKTHTLTHTYAEHVCMYMPACW